MRSCVSACIYKFDEFELDPSRFELRKNGRVLKLERIPMDLLILLAEKEGSLATRREIIERLWGKDVFVDTEHGINTAVRKIRQVLRDDPEQPRFVQTVTGKGYRFVAGKADDRKMASAGPETADAAKTLTGAKAIAPVAGETSAKFSSQTSPASIPGSGSRRRVFIIATLVVFVCATGLFSVNAGGVRDRIFSPNRAVKIHSIAVIPLTNLSGDASQDYFADGMTDELITAIAKNHSLRVVSRTSAMQYKGVQRPVRDIASELRVDGILEGSISRSTDRVHMTVQLIYAPTDSHVWAESYDRDLNHAYSLPEELSRTIAKEVKLATSPKPTARYINPEAYDAYLRGRYYWFAVDIDQSQQAFEKAIQLQPDYAAAWSGLADAYGLRAVYGLRPGSDAMTKMESAARKAVELDDSSAEAHNSLTAWYFFFAWDPQRALAEADRALALNSPSTQSHFLRAHALIALHRTDEAIQEEKRFVELNPFVFPWALGFRLSESWPD
jgi:TolB-like protein/DNA-binding winged helix-turn-helix (wHTH) protein